MARVDGLATAYVPVEFLALDSEDQPIDSVGTFVLSNIVVAISRASDGYVYDWSTGAFAETPVTPSAALEAYNTDEYPGLFHVAAGWLPPGDDTYSFAYSQDGSPAVVANLPASRTLVVGEYVGTATIGTNLVDELVSVADELREELHADMGVRQFRVYGVRGEWSGATHGYGSHAITEVYEFIPSPLVMLADKRSLEPGGLMDQGTCKLKEISLTYTQAQILGEPAADEDWHIVVVDGLGQGISRRVFLPQDDPETDRDGDIGWSVTLRLDSPHNVVA